MGYTHIYIVVIYICNHMYIDIYIYTYTSIPIIPAISPLDTNFDPSLMYPQKTARQRMLRGKEGIMSLAQGIVHWAPPAAALEAGRSSLLAIDARRSFISPCCEWVVPICANHISTGGSISTMVAGYGDFGGSMGKWIVDRYLIFGKPWDDSTIARSTLQIPPGASSCIKVTLDAFLRPLKPNMQKPTRIPNLENHLPKTHHFWDS